MRALLLLAAISAATAQTPNGVNFFSVEKEIALGKNLAAQFQAKQQAQPDARLQSIGDRLAAKTDGAYRYSFFVYPQVSPEYEPIALPGGAVFVAQTMVAADDADMAAILAHAIAHIALRHYTREETRRELTQIGMNGSAGAVGANSDSMQLRPNSQLAQMNRSFELDADQFAVKLMLDARYSPESLVRWLQSFPIPKETLAFGDRPAPSARIAAVQRAIEAAR